MLSSRVAKTTRDLSGGLSFTNVQQGYSSRRSAWIAKADLRDLLCDCGVSRRLTRLEMTSSCADYSSHRSRLIGKSTDLLFAFAHAFDPAEQRAIALQAIDDPLREIVLGIFEYHFAGAALDQLERGFRLSGRFRDEENLAVQRPPGSA